MQPQEIKDIKTFLNIARRADAKCQSPPCLQLSNVAMLILFVPAAIIKKSVSRKVGATGTAVTKYKFKVRCSRYLYTFVLLDADRAAKLRESLPPSTFSSAFVQLSRRLTCISIHSVEGYRHRRRAKGQEVNAHVGTCLFEGIDR